MVATRDTCALPVYLSGDDFRLGIGVIGAASYFDCAYSQDSKGIDFGLEVDQLRFAWLRDSFWNRAGCALGSAVFRLGVFVRLLVVELIDGLRNGLALLAKENQRNGQ